MSGYPQIDPRDGAHIIHDAPEGYHQQYNMTQEEYEAAIQQQMMMEHQQMMGAMGEGQEFIDANSYVQGLLEKTSKMSEGGEEGEL